MSRFAVLVAAAGLGLFGAPEVRACSLVNGVWYYAPRANGPQPRNGGVLAVTVGHGDPGHAAPAVFPVFDDAGAAIAHQAMPLQGYTSPEAVYLLRETASPAPGGKRIYRGLAAPDPPLLQLEYGDELDVTPPNLQGPIRLWVDRGHSVGACPGGPFPGYVAGVRLPQADERAIVSIYETDRTAGDQRLLREVIVHPDQPAGEARFDFSAQTGSTVCLAFKTTDLAGNATALGAPCCADEKAASGPCERVDPPPRQNFVPDSSSSGGGCSLSPRSRAGAAWIWMVMLFGYMRRKAGR